MCACMHASECGRACTHGTNDCICAGVRACARACVRARVRACARACGRACGRTCARVRVKYVECNASRCAKQNRYRHMRTRLVYECAHVHTYAGLGTGCFGASFFCFCAGCLLPERCERLTRVSRRTSWDLPAAQDMQEPSNDHCSHKHSARCLGGGVGLGPGLWPRPGLWLPKDCGPNSGVKSTKHCRLNTASMFAQNNPATVAA